MSKFSGALQITDLDDFISPSVQCVISPAPQPIKRSSGTGSKIKIESDGYYEVEERTGKKQKLEKVEITLGDCLACSGCITSAEAILIGQQNHDEILKVFNTLNSEDSEYDTIVVSMALQPILSIAEKYHITPDEAAGRISKIFKTLQSDSDRIKVFQMTPVDELVLIESAKEFVQRYRNKEQGQMLPMLASSCPGWICYAEKTHGEFILPYVSTTKSAQQMMGSLVKDKLGRKRTYHITVMPCYDKKLEASRNEFFSKEENAKDVDCVITALEIEHMIKDLNIEFETLSTAPLDTLWPEEDTCIRAVPGSASGGFAHFLYHYAAKELFDMTPNEITWEQQRNSDFLEAVLEKDGKPVLRFAIANGFRNIQNIVFKMKRKKMTYDYVEIMACPSGCLNGGGQIRPSDVTQVKELVARLVDTHGTMKKSDGLGYIPIYDWLGGTSSDKGKALLHTSYKAVAKMNSVLNIKW